MKESDPERNAPCKIGYARLFWEWFKIALFVVGGGYAIIAVADDVFGRRLKWLDEGELIEHLPIISSIPGLIAGNSAIYVGLKVRGRVGAIMALAGVALPSIMIFLAVSAGFGFIPKENRWIDGAFLGLRSALTGVIAGTVWRALFKARVDWSKGIGVDVPRLSLGGRAVGLALFALGVAFASVFAWDSFWTFLKFGCIAIGGGFPLVPFYFQSFVGGGAPMLNMSPEDFSNLMALTQMTPGPVSLNAATFFGFRLNGPVGSFVASAALLVPSYILLTAVLSGLDRWRRNRAVRVLVWLLKPVSVALMSMAMYRFGALCIWGWDGGFVFRPWALALASFAAVMLVKRRLSIMALIFVCAVLGVAAVPFSWECGIIRF